VTTFQSAIAAVQAQFPELDLEPKPLVDRGPNRPAGDQKFIAVPPDRLIAVLTFLRDHEACLFEQLCDLTCVDYLNFPRARDRYGVIYSLLSLTHNHRLWIKCFVNDPAPAAPTATIVWSGADWMEREIYDMFGITFEGHPDLRRILTWDGFEAFPLRKDYPLRGRGERENYETLTRESS
jgi:NADH-quinone oxidoreductase subunit C